MRKLSAKQEQEIIKYYTQGVKKTLIKRWYKIKDAQLASIVKAALAKEDNKENKK
ncbi:MAG: hypothetical protein HY841_04955 [Bacteroidetes bacterium]|nr:hypothetical protein [Bacteroidota bacterium]